MKQSKIVGSQDKKPFRGQMNQKAKAPGSRDHNKTQVLGVCNYQRRFDANIKINSLIDWKVDGSMSARMIPLKTNRMTLTHRRF